jgi:type IV fimbrial biogenesis protein FimT
MKFTQIRRQAGMTLVELMVTLAIAGTLASFSLPALGNLVRGTQSKTAGASLANSLNLARMTAVNKQRDVVVCPSRDHANCDDDIAWQNGWISFVDQNGEPVLEVADARVGTLITATEGRKHVEFHPDGSAPGTNLTLTICEPNASAASTIVVSNSGRVRNGIATMPKVADTCGG